MKRTLSEVEARALAAIQHRGDTPLTEVAKAAGLRVTQLRHALKQLENKQVYRGISIFVDPIKLGYECVSLSFSLHADHQSKVEAILRGLCNSKRVMFLGSVTGTFQYIATICVKSTSELWQFFASLKEPLGRALQSKAFGVHYEFVAFGRRYLSSRVKEYPRLSYGGAKSAVQTLSNVDHSVLALLRTDGSLSVREISRKLGIPSSTVQRHLQALSHSGVIKGFVYQANLLGLGTQQFKLLLYTRGISDHTTKRLMNFCLRELHVVRFIVCLGSWDYEIDIEVLNADYVAEFQQRLSAEFAQELNAINSLQILRHLWFSSFPVDAGA